MSQEHTVGNTRHALKPRSVDVRAWAPSLLSERWSPKDGHVLIPRAWEYVIFQCKGEFTNIIKDLEMGRFSWVDDLGRLTVTAGILKTEKDLRTEHGSERRKEATLLV